MAENDTTNTLGKKIFFLYPSVFVQNNLVPGLVQDEFEVYTIKDEVKLRHLLKRYPDSVVFANINEGLRENVLDDWIRGIVNAGETAGVSIGVFSSMADENQKRKYVEQFKLPCGYTVLKQDPAGVVRQVTDILNRVNAKGRRKYIRVVIEPGPNTTVNLPLNGTFVNGTIKDISVVGFSCSFAEDPVFAKNTLFGDMQLRLQTQLLRAEGIVFGSREGADGKNYVILFTQRISPDVRVKIRKYIQASLQSKMEHELR